MLKTSPITYYCLLVICSFICVNSQAQSAQTGNKIVATKTPTYFINALGDTIPYGVPLPIKGQLISPDSVQPPSDYDPIKIKPQNILAHPNVQTVGERINTKISTISASPEQLAYLNNFSRDTLDIPVTITLVKQPKPIPALGVGRKEAALENFSLIQETHGLPKKRINDLYEDNLGNLWIATLGGIIRYDGVNFFHFTKKEGLTNNRIYKIIADDLGVLWFISPTGIEKYDGKYFTFFDTSKELMSFRYSASEFSKVVWSFSDNSRLDYLFKAKDGGGYVLFDGANFVKYPVLQPISTSKENSRLIGIDKQKQFWYATEKGIARFNGRTFTHFELDNSGALYYPKLDKQGNLWLSLCCGKEGLYKINEDAINFYPLKFKKTGWGDANNYSLLEDKAGNLWFGTHANGLFKLPVDQKASLPATFIEYGPQAGMTGREIYAIIESSHGNIWVSGDNDGLYKIENLKFRHYTEKEGVLDGHIMEIIEDKEEHLTFLSQPYGLLYYDGKNFTKSIPFGAPSVPLLADEGGDLWVGHTGYGAVQLKNLATNPIGKHFYKEETGIKGIIILDIVQDKQNNLWFTSVDHRGGDKGGITHYNPQTEQFTHLTTKEGLKNNPHGLFLDSKGKLWFGIDGTISCITFDTTVAGVEGQIIHYPIAQESIKPNMFRFFLEDSKQRIWIGTDEGIVYHTPINKKDGQNNSLNEQLVQFEVLATADGVVVDRTAAIVEDHQQNIWLSSSKGLTILRPVINANETTEDVVKVGIDSYQIFKYGKKEGMRATSLISNYLDKNNRMWWGNLEGLMYLDLDDFELPNQAPQHIQLTQLDVNNEFINFPNLTDTAYQNTLAFGPQLTTAFDSILPLYNYPVGLVLPHQLNHLTFHFSAIDWTAPHQIQYSYKIEGLDKEWSPPNAEPKVDYRNLPAGNFTFKVKAKGIAHTWSDSFDYPFTILPPWWLTWWAKMLYALAGIAAIVGYNKWRTTALKKRQFLLEETVMERTKEVVAEKNKSEELLLNILPSEIATELKRDGVSPARDFNNVTVLFTDFKAFTIVSEQLSARDLVAEINVCFKAFDEIITRYGIEKIKTIGDAYLAAGGLQLKHKTSPGDVIKAALEMQTFIQKRKKERTAMDLPGFEMRCGIHTGPVVAGIVGVKKFQYDIWGDTVNVASRMESNSAVGKVNLSKDTYQLVQDNPLFTFEARGKVAAKNKGEIEMYYVNSVGV